MPFVMPKGIKKVVTIHDVAFRYFPSSYLLHQRYYLDFTTRIAAKKADKIITISESTKNDLVGLYDISPDKIQVIHLGFDEPKKIEGDLSEHSWKDFCVRHKINKDFLLFIGRVESKKNIINLVRAFYDILSEGKDLQLVLAGKKGNGFAEINEVIKEYNLQDRVVITGYVREEDKNQLLKNAKALTFVSRYEGFGIPILEALYFGLPVIASRIPVFEELFSNSVYMVNPNEPREIAEGVLKVLGNSNRREALIKHGKELVKEFSWEKCARKTLETLEGLGTYVRNR
jgi:glycosyltransferase involved in cell wall biosynthesis